MKNFEPKLTAWKKIEKFLTGIKKFTKIISSINFS